jgi:hypothetical protein
VALQTLSRAWLPQCLGASSSRNETAADISDMPTAGLSRGLRSKVHGAGAWRYPPRSRSRIRCAARIKAFTHESKFQMRNTRHSVVDETGGRCTGHDHLVIAGLNPKA